MEEIIFTYDTSVEKFKQHMSYYTAKDIERFIGTLYTYIETLSCQEMNQRIHEGKEIEFTNRPVFETEMDGVKKMASVLKKFLKNSGQID